MRYLISFMALFVITSVATLAQPTEETLEHDGLMRNYLIYVPASYTGESSVPLLFALHGGGGDAEGMIQLTEGGLNTLAEEHQFIVVYPNGINNSWNDGRQVDIGKHSTADDIGFFSMMIDEIAGRYTIDEERVFVTGMSNGGMMSYRLACDLSERIAGIAPVAANMSVALADECSPEYETDILIMLGSDDPIVPYNGGEIKVLGSRRGEVLPADAIADFWTAQFHCEGDPSTVEYPNTAPFDGTHITEARYDICDNGTRVRLMTIHGGGHTWASGLPYLGRLLIGRTSRDVDANSVIWEFFEG